MNDSIKQNQTLSHCCTPWTWLEDTLLVVLNCCYVLRNKPSPLLAPPPHEKLDDWSEKSGKLHRQMYYSRITLLTEKQSISYPVRQMYEIPPPLVNKDNTPPAICDVWLSSLAVFPFRPLHDCILFSNLAVYSSMRLYFCLCHWLIKSLG